ncbi:MAG: response regulator [Verrucomicrobiota bacterium]
MRDINLQKSTGSMILVVEDQATDAKLIRRAIDRAGLNVPVTLVSSGEKAISLVKEYFGGAIDHHDAPPVLMLLDLNLPGMNGFEILRELKGMNQLKRLPIVVLTSSDEPADVDRAYDLGANGYVVKPLDGNGYDALAEKIGSFWFGSNIAPSVTAPAT